MDTLTRVNNYHRQNGSNKLTPAQRKRATKRAGTDPNARVDRYQGYPAYEGARHLMWASEPPRVTRWELEWDD